MASGPEPSDRMSCSFCLGLEEETRRDEDRTAMWVYRYEPLRPGGFISDLLGDERLDVLPLGQEVAPAEAGFPPQRTHSPMALRRREEIQSSDLQLQARSRADATARARTSAKHLTIRSVFLTICLHRRCSISEIRNPALPTGSKKFLNSL